VLAAGGLVVICTERHESRRIDNQLRGRSGRQGDPGATQFYLSLEDDLMRLFGGDRMDRISAIMLKTKLPDDVPIQHPMVSKSVEGAQRKIEQLNFQARKNVLEYDDVMNNQRKVIYTERNKILDGKDIHAHVQDVIEETVEREVLNFIPERSPQEEWDLEGINNWVHEMVGNEDFDAYDIDADDDPEVMVDETYSYVAKIYNKKEEALGEEIMRELESQVMLRVIDSRWMAHLSEMDYIKAGIGLRGYGQRDPLVEYKQEAYDAFSSLVATMYEDFLRTILRLELSLDEVPQEEQASLQNLNYSGPEEVDGDHGGGLRGHAMQAGVGIGAQGASTNQPQGARKPYVKAEDNNPFVGVGRNDPCPCGSGLKFKNCHGKNL
ncbi:MAG: SEC-C metal-binding domain-containing protein, partial [Coriobacteriia bacterium]|nr:SEC-C metal-binding domain-containing protein [Coriobacteriia bacterium]